MCICVYNCFVCTCMCVHVSVLSARVHLCVTVLSARVYLLCVTVLSACVYLCVLSARVCARMSVRYQCSEEDTETCGLGKQSCRPQNRGWGGNLPYANEDRALPTEPPLQTLKIILIPENVSSRNLPTLVPDVKEPGRQGTARMSYD